MVSAIKSAGWPASSSARRTAATSVTQPVDVSLWTTHTALISWAVSALRRSAMAAASAPLRQSPGRNSGARPRRSASRFHRVAKWPVSYISTRSPGDRVLTRAASQAPVPEEGKMMTGCSVLKMVRRPDRMRLASAWNFGPRWSMVGRSMARRMRSGTFVGPGICRKCRPALYAIAHPPCGAAGAACAHLPATFFCDHNLNYEFKTESRGTRCAFSAVGAGSGGGRNGE